MDDIPADRRNHTDNHGLHDLAAARFVAGGSSWNGIRANLAEMERKLGELQQQVDPAQPRQVLPHVAASYPAAPHSLLPEAAATPAAQAQAVQVKQQIEDLLRVRELLRESLRGAMGECERMLRQLDRGESIAPALGEPLLAVRPSVFQGSVLLRVGPLEDISQVDTLEIALLQVPGAEQVEVKEFSGRDAVAEIKLFQPVRLVEELHRVLPFSFEVTHGDATALTLLANGETVAAGMVQRKAHGGAMNDLSHEWHPADRRPLTPVVIVVVAVMVASAVFWVGFMLAPAAVLLVGYLALSAGDRAQRQRLVTLPPPADDDSAEKEARA